MRNDRNKTEKESGVCSLMHLTWPASLRSEVSGEKECGQIQLSENCMITRTWCKKAANTSLKVPFYALTNMGYMFNSFKIPSLKKGWDTSQIIEKKKKRKFQISKMNSKWHTRDQGRMWPRCGLHSKFSLQGEQAGAEVSILNWYSQNSF